MRSKPLILKTKLVSPRLKSTILRRQKIIKKMRMIADYPLTIVHSGPGYGKSTAVSSYFRDESAAVCWYTVSPEDTLIPYVQYIIHSVRVHIPSFAIDIETDFINRENMVKEETIYLLCTELINEFLRYQEEIVLVIDDFHLIENSEGIQQWMSWFIQHLPDTIRLVIISRTKPKWDILTAMKVRGTLLEITEVDLTSFCRGNRSFIYRLL